MGDLVNRATHVTAYHQSDVVAEARREHRTIADAIRAHEPDAARAAMQSHLRRGLERLIEAVQ